MKQAKIWKWLCAVLWILQFAVEALTVYTIARLDMLPDQYLGLIAGIFGFLWVLMGLLLLPGKNNAGGIRRTIAAVLVMIICVGCAVAVTVVSDVYETMQGVLGQPGNNDTKPKRSVYVMKDDPAQTLLEAKGYTFAVVENFDTANVQQVLDAIEAVHGQTPETVSYSSLSAMVDGLYAGEVDAIVVSEANLLVLEAQDAYVDFHDKTRLLYELEIVEKTPPPTTAPTDPDNPDPTDPEEPTEPQMTVPVIVEPKDITNTPFIVYIAGSDTRSNYLSNSRNDVNILAVVNPETKQILLINTPRDYYVKNPAGNNARDKLTHCGIYGVENSAKALGYLYGDRVDYYAQINFAGFKTFIDAVDGITVYSDVSFTTSGGYSFSKGENHLYGEEALVFARERYSFSDGDESRGQNQMKVIRAVIQKITSGTTIITRYAEILNSLEGMFSTNLSMEEISQLVKMQLSDMSSWNIMSYAVSGYGDYEYTYSMPGEDLYVMWPNTEMVAHATELIDRVIAGEILTQSDLG